MEELENSETEPSQEDLQEARAYLRKRFLHAVSKMIGQPVTINMQENTRVTGVFTGSDVDVLQFLIKDLNTAIGVQPIAILRTSDIINMRLAS